MRRSSGEDVAYDLAVDIGEAVVTALELEGEPGVIHAEAVEQGGVQIMNVDRIARDVVVEVVGFTERESRSDSAAGHPQGEAAGMMVPSVVLSGESSLAIDCSSELASPHDEGVVEQSTLREVLHESGGRLIGIAALSGQLRWEF